MNTVDGRVVHDLVEVYVIHGTAEFVEVDDESGRLCCAFVKDSIAHQNDREKCIA